MLLLILVIFVIVCSIIGIVATAFDISALAATGIMVGAIVGMFMLVLLMSIIAQRSPKFGEFVKKYGFTPSFITIGTGIFMTIVGACTDAGEEVRSYTKIDGTVVFYLADAFASLYWIGLVVIFVGVALLLTFGFTAIAINEEGSPKEKSSKIKETKVKDVLVRHGWKLIVGNKANLVEVYKFHSNGRYIVTKTSDFGCKEFGGLYRIDTDKNTIVTAVTTFAYSWEKRKLKLHDKNGQELVATQNF